jgi:coenzyme F420-0:L-glutamate ligase/coenzyme F420-1:gamma-L-glutamate ligase
MTLTLTGVPGIPEIGPGIDLAQLLGDALASADLSPRPYDILVIAQKIVSKAEGRFVLLEDVTPSLQAEQLAARVGKDARLVQVILQESSEISRSAPGVLVVRHRLGFVSANAGVDRSNVPQDGTGERVLLLPVDPDKSAETLRATLEARFAAPLGVIIADSHGRPHRLGTIGVAIGVSGLPALVDRRGTPDREGFRLQHTDIGFADELAAAAGLVMGQAAEGLPLVLVRGVCREGSGRAADLYRPRARDLYR